MRKWYLLLLMISGIVFAAPCQASSEGIPEFPKEEYQKVFRPDNNDLYVLTFTAQWCAPCKKFMKEALVPLFTQYGAQEKIHFYLVDMTHPQAEGLQFSNQLNVNVYPTTIILKDGAQIYSSGQRGYDKKVESEIKEILATYK